MLKRGDVVAKPGLLKGTTLVDVEFRYLSGIERPLRHNAEVKFFSGAAEALARVRLIGERELVPGETGWLQLRLAEPIALDRGDRFILRFPSPGQTIGGGQILDAHPPHRWRRFKQESVSRFETLAVGSPAELVLQALDSGLAFLPDRLGEEVGLEPSALDVLLVQLEQQGDIFRLPEHWIISSTSWSRFCGFIQDELANFHAQAPLRSGMPREALRSRLNANNKVFNYLIARGASEGLFTDEGTAIRLPDHSVSFNPNQQAAVDQLEQLIRSSPFAPPSVKEAVAVTGENVFQALVEQKYIIQVSQDVFFDRATFDIIVKGITDFIMQHGTINVGEARDLFGTSRKYMLALLEYLDTAGITVRQGDDRVLR